MIKVLIADDHALFREMLYHTLSEEEDISVVGEAVNGREAIQKTKEMEPDIVLLDIDMPVLNGIEATTAIKRVCPSTKVVILTALDDDSFVFQLVRAGATGYLMKDTSSDEVLRAIRAAYFGESLIQPRVVNKILREFIRLVEEREALQSREARQELEMLTEREREVLGLVAQGMNNKEIAAALIVSEATVKTHVANLMHKLGLRDRVEMVLFAVQAGLVKEGRTDRRSADGAQ